MIDFIFKSFNKAFQTVQNIIFDSIYYPVPIIVAGKNFTPAQLPAQARRKLTELCDDALCKSIKCFTNSKSLVGVGRFAEQRIKEVCKTALLPHRQMYLLHPSPQNPNANKSWTPIARRSFEELGILSPVIKENVADRPSCQVADDAAVKRKLFQNE